VYHTFRIQLALDLIAASGSASGSVAPLIRAIPNVTTVARGMNVQWFVHQEDQFGAFLPDPESHLIWEVVFDNASPFRDASYRCILRTTAADFRAPLVHAADAEPIRVEHAGRFEYEARVADEGGHTISLERAVLIVP
jgi:hypothetical protein